MEFKVFNAKNSPHVKVKPGRREPNITVCHNGSIILNPCLLKLLEQPERVIVLEDKDYPGDFYIMAQKDPSAFVLEQADKRGARRILCSSLVDYMEKCTGVKTPFLVPVSEDGKQTSIGTVYSLAVRKARPINRKPVKPVNQ